MKNILELQGKLKNVLNSVTDEEVKPKLQTQIQFFSDAVEINLKQIDFVLTHIDTPTSRQVSRASSPAKTASPNKSPAK